MAPDLEVRRVDRDAIFELRRRVLSGPEAQVGGFRWDLAPSTRHWAALAAGEIVGCVTVVRLRGYALRGMAVSVDHQRRGVGAAMMRVVHAEVSEPMWCNARLEVVGFYAGMGWTPVGPIFDIQHHGPHQRMNWSGPVVSLPAAPIR